MKKVFTDTSTIAHLWANQLQDEASNGKYGNFYFDGPTIYSYGSHFAIARHVEVNGKKAVLFTTSSYSNTTAKHIRIVRQAANHLAKIYCVNPRFAPGYAEESYHAGNFNAWTKEIEYIAESLPNARKPEIYLNQIAQQYDQAVKYAEFFGIEIPATLRLVGSISNKAEYSQYAAARLEIIKAEREREFKEARKKNKEQLKKWRAFETPRISTRANEDFLRYNSEHQRVETSQAVQIPVLAAEKFYRYVLDIVAKGGCTNCTGQILNYKVTEINKEFIKVGCHKIAMTEIEGIAKLLKW